MFESRLLNAPSGMAPRISASRNAHDNSSITRMTRQKKIWIDLDNSPHVPFFAPIIKELEARGHLLMVTAREFAQVTQLAQLKQIRFKTIGRHYGKNTLLKMAGVVVRAGQLAPLVQRVAPDLAVSHGSRSQLLLASVLRLPCIDINDYEHATDFRVIRPSWMIVPELIPSSSWNIPCDRVLQYPGIKEDVYVPQFRPDPSLLSQLNISADALLVTLRPPAGHAHYHNPESDAIFTAVVSRLVETENVVTVVLPRTEGQKREMKSRWGKHFHSGRLIVPPQAIDGLNLIWHSDLVISGGGTMNREAAALRVPVYSTFRGKLGAVDQYLAKQKRLILIESVADVITCINLAKRDRHIERCGNCTTLTAIVDYINRILERE